MEKGMLQGTWKGIKFCLKILILIVFASWILIVFYDYFTTLNDQNPKFCIAEKTYTYDDGTTYECVGLGYKVYKYNRSSIHAKEFGPFFIKQRTDTSGIEN